MIDLPASCCAQVAGTSMAPPMQANKRAMYAVVAANVLLFAYVGTSILLGWTAVKCPACMPEGAGKAASTAGGFMMPIGLENYVVGHDSYLVTEAIFSNFPTYQADAIASKCQSCLQHAKTHVEYKVGSHLALQ